MKWTILILGAVRFFWQLGIFMCMNLMKQYGIRKQNNTEICFLKKKPTQNPSIIFKMTCSCLLRDKDPTQGTVRDLSCYPLYVMPLNQHILPLAQMVDKIIYSRKLRI